jgi:hypothetical protein
MMEQLYAEVSIAVNDLTVGNVEDAARRFVDSVAPGQGSWDGLVPDEAKRTLINNAPTFLDECRDPEAGFGLFAPTLTDDMAKLAGFRAPCS